MRISQLQRFRLLLASLLGITQLSLAASLNHVRVIWQEDPAHQATLAWTNASKVGSSTLYWDTENHGNDLALYRQQSTPHWSNRYHWQGDYGYHVNLSSLNPATTYYVVIEQDGQISPVYHFVTAPANFHNGQKFHLLFGGDSRSDRSSRQEMNRRIKDLFEQAPSILALVHGGDYVADGSNWSEWKSWLDDYMLTTAADGRLLPIVPARGNHEIDAELFNRLFNSPGNGKVYYVTRIGDFTIVNLNTEISMGGDQQQWLASTLAHLAGSARWITANYHRPAWPAVKTPSGALQHWVPLFEKYALDLVFESDGHTLKRTVPIRNQGRDDRHGVIYVGEGGLGVKQRSPSRAKEWYLQAPGYAVSAHHVQKLAISESELVYEVVLKDGRTYDHLKLQARQRSPDGGNRNDPPAREPADQSLIRLENLKSGACLQFRTGLKDDALFQDPCQEAETEIFQVHALSQGDKTYQLMHQQSGLCLKASEHWIFFGRWKTILSECQEDDSAQAFRFQPQANTAWKIRAVTKNHCLHASDGWKTKDENRHVYLTNCSANEQKEEFNLLPTPGENE